MSIKDKTLQHRMVLQSHSKLDKKGRCCGKKPIKYKRDDHYFCPRCDRSFSLETEYQIESWAWTFKTDPDRFVKITVW